MFPSSLAWPAIPAWPSTLEWRLPRRGRAKLARDRHQALERKLAHDRLLRFHQHPRERPLGGKDLGRKPVTVLSGEPVGVTLPGVSEGAARRMDHRDFGADADRKPGEMRREREIEIVSVKAIEG